MAINTINAPVETKFLVNKDGDMYFPNSLQKITDKLMIPLGGFGWYIWIISECGTPQEIADLCIINGVAHIMPKIADGVYDYNKANGDPAKQLTQAAQKLGITVWGWQYVYLANPIAEADKAYQRIQETGCTGFVIDAEGEWKEQMSVYYAGELKLAPQWELSGGAEKAEQYLSRLRDLVGPDFPLALSSYRYPSYHPEFPWEVARSYVDLDMPQVYWLLDHNPVYQLNKSYNEFKNMTPRLPYLPTGAAWKEQGWAPTADDVSGFIATCKGLGLPGYNFWSYQHAKRDLPDVWALLMPNKDEEPPMVTYQFKVLTDGLSIRTGPDVTYSKIGTLAKDTIVTALDMRVGKSSWVQHSQGWSAVYYYGQNLHMQQVFG